MNSDTVINKVAQSGIITLDLVTFFPDKVQGIDMKDFLYEGLILKEKDFREMLKNTDFSSYTDQYVYLFCSAESIIPTWAYMLLTTTLLPFTSRVVQASDATYARLLFAQLAIASYDVGPLEGKRVVMKGCGQESIPESIFVAITAKVQPVSQSIMYGEPCSTVPIYKKK